MKSYIIILIVLLAVEINSIAQTQINDSLRITGVVLEQDSLSTLPYSRFKLDSETYMSDEAGQFSFWAKQGETVRFSHLGFKDTYIRIDDVPKHKNYMLGVFLTRDTIQISEVIVMPRYENLSLQAKTMPLIITPDAAYATNNVRASTHQALTQTPLKMDAEMNQRMVLQEQTWGTVYKTQVHPDRSISISSENTDQMRLFTPRNAQKIKAISLQPLNRNELDFIIRIYEERMRKKICTTTNTE